MAITKIEIKSRDMNKAIKFVKIMTKSMIFDENMETMNWQKARRRNDFFYRLIPEERSAFYKKVKLGSTLAMKATPNNMAKMNDERVIIYIHGGGFVTGNAFVSKSYVSMLVKYLNCVVYAVDYSLAPEHPFPEGFNECCEAYEEIIKEHPEAKITLVGESAGGNLCLALAHKYKNDGRIASVIANSPVVDFTGTIDHHINENKDFIVKFGSAVPLKKMYVKDNDATNPFISPICGDFNGFPATFITCDVNETLYADSKSLYEKCIDANVEAEMIEVKGAYHAFAVTGTSSPETTNVLEKSVLFINAH